MGGDGKGPARTSLTTTLCSHRKGEKKGGKVTGLVRVSKMTQTSEGDSQWEAEGDPCRTNTQSTDGCERKRGTRERGELNRS